jgi:anti-sigma-K factor RskA
MTDDPTAAEYALGLLEGRELQAARHRARTDTDFAAEVAWWRGHLATLADEVSAVQPPQSVRKRIERAVATNGGENVVDLQRLLHLWRGAAAASTAIAASLALILVTREIQPPASPPSSPMVALIKAGSGVAAVASLDRDSRRLLVTEVNMPVTPRHDYELWLIPNGGKPRSLGVMPNAPHMRLALTEPMSAMVRSGSILAVSLEPSGGSRSDGPSGPVVASGEITTA